VLHWEILWIRAERRRRMEEESRSMGMEESRKQRAWLDRLEAHLPHLEHLEPLQFYSVNQYSFHACLCPFVFVCATLLELDNILPQTWVCSCRHTTVDTHMHFRRRWLLLRCRRRNSVVRTRMVWSVHVCGKLVAR
jgi:hypothetical protein